DFRALLPGGPARGGGRSARRGPTRRRRAGPQARDADGAVLAADRILARRRPRAGGGGGRLLRDPGRGLGVQPRLPDPESGPLAVRRRGAVGGVHPGVHRAARGRQAPRGLPARRSDVRAHPRRPRNHHRAHARAGAGADPGSHRLGVRRRARHADRRPLAGDVPHRRPSRPQRTGGRRAQRARSLLDSRAGAGDLEPGDHRRAGRPTGLLRGRRAHLRLRDRRAGRHGRPARDVARGVQVDRLHDADLVRLARSPDPPDPRPDAARDDRARPDQLQHAHQRRPRLGGLRVGLRRDQLRLPHLHAAAGHVLRGGGHRPVPRPVAAGDAPRRRRPAGRARHRHPPDRAAADPGHGRHPGPRRADDAARLRTRGVRGRVDRPRLRGAVLVRPLAALLGRQPAADPDLLLPPAPVDADRAGRAHAAGQRAGVRRPLSAFRDPGDRLRDGRRQHRHDRRTGDRPAPPARRPRARADAQRLRDHARGLRAARRGRLRRLVGPRRGPRPLPSRSADQRGSRRGRRHGGLRGSAAGAEGPGGARHRRDAGSAAAPAAWRL
ncbi:MAG: Proposed peptidoglycan lipid II flippase MurJ, partial [uncultured Solirubrobacteraceae bacterium]